MSNSNQYVSAQMIKILILYLKEAYIRASASDSTVAAQENLWMVPVAKEANDDKIDLETVREILSAFTNTYGQFISGLQLAEGLHSIYSRNNILMNIMANCSTVKIAIEKLVQYHDISTNAIRLLMEYRGTQMVLTWEVEPGLMSGYPVLIDAVMASCCMMLRDITRNCVKFKEVHFDHEAQENPNDYMDLFGCPVIFSSDRNKVCIDETELSTLIGLSDPKLLRVLEQYAQSMLSGSIDEHSFSSYVADLVGNLIMQGRDFDISSVAQKLLISKRTLQVRLKEDNTTFRCVIDRVRQRIAEKCLESPDTMLIDIAFLLGFSEQSAFNHAFRKWTGKTPGEYRSDPASCCSATRPFVE